MHGLDLSIEALPLGLEQLQVSGQCGRGVSVAVKEVGDGRRAEAKLTQEQDALQLHQTVLVVVAVTIFPTPLGVSSPSCL